MKNRLLLLTAFTIFLTGCAVMTPSLKARNPVGKVYRDSIRLWERTIPLPEGEWKVIGRGGSDYEHYFDILLLKEFETKKVHSLLRISVESMTNNYPGYLPNKYLERKGVHHVVVKNNAEGGAHDGWLIDHSPLGISIDPNSNDRHREAYDYLLLNKITTPKFSIQTYHHFTGKYQKNKYLNVSYFIIPEGEGFETPSGSDWNTSEWHPLRIGNDPKKVAFIERLKTEGAIMHEKIRAGFGD